MPHNRAYSILEIKGIDEERRIILGVATTPEPDRASDIVEPKGAEFKLPIPFLMQHDSSQPIGHVTKAKVTDAGIDVEVQLTKIDEPGKLKDRLDEAWQLIRSKLVRGLSIGFRSLEDAFIKETGGIRFVRWSWLELSAVVIAANASASITTIRSLDAPFLAASGRKNGVVTLSPGASGKPQSISRKEKDVKTIQDQIAEWEAKRAAKTARSEAIMAKSAEEGRTLDEAEAEEHDAISAEVKGIDKHLERLADTQKTSIAKAAPVKGANPEEGRESRQPGSGIQVLEPKLEKGIGFARLAKCLALSARTYRPAEDIAKEIWPNYTPLHNITKAAVAAGTAADSVWAGPLVQYQILANEFAEFLRPQTIIGKFGTGNIPSLRRVPFNIKLPRQTSKGSGYWVGEGKPKPLTKFALESVTLDFSKVATIAVITEELLRFSSPSAEMLVRDEIAAAVIERIDIDFVDPNKAVSSGVSPASITNGATAIVSSGDTAAAVFTDIQAVVAPFIQANLPLNGAVWIMNANVALALSLMQTSLGNPQFPGISMAGGVFQGIPVIVSQYVPSAVVILAAASEIMLADDGNVTIDVSREASLEMKDSSLSQDATAGTGVSLVSMFQSNSVAFLAEREINWKLRRSGAVVYLTSANWGGTAGSGDI